MPDHPPRYGAIDLGGTKVRAIVADLDGNIFGEDIRPSLAAQGLDATLGAMMDSLDAALAVAGAERGDLRGLGMASPGAMDVTRGVVTSAPQLVGWKEVSLLEIMRGKLSAPLWLDNDANAGALGEHTFGAGRGSRHMIYLTVSTGLGGGIIINGELYRGARGFAGEIGHASIDLHGPECGFGGRGCLESLASGTAIAKRGQELLASAKAPLLGRLTENEGAVTCEMMARAARDGDEACREVFQEAGHYLGITLANCVNIFNPEVIVIGGGVALAADLFMQEATETMEARAIRESLRDVRLELGTLGERAGSLGMIALMRRAVGT
jgi:glucokinase